MKQRTPFKERLSDALLELLFGAITVAVGIGIFIIFGENPWNMDFEILALAGLGALTAIVLTVVLAVIFIKKRRNKKQKR